MLFLVSLIQKTLNNLQISLNKVVHVSIWYDAYSTSPPPTTTTNAAVATAVDQGGGSNPELILKTFIIICSCQSRALQISLKAGGPEVKW